MRRWGYLSSQPVYRELKCLLEELAQREKKIQQVLRVPMHNRRIYLDNVVHALDKKNTTLEVMS